MVIRQITANDKALKSFLITPIQHMYINASTLLFEYPRGDAGGLS